MNIPEGWKLVPIEPTPHMCVQGFCVSESEHDPAGVYRAMLAAAPTPPAQEAAPVAFRMRNASEKDWGDDVTVLPIRFLERNKLPDMVIGLLYDHPQSDELREAAEEILNVLDDPNPTGMGLLNARDNLRAALEAK